MFSSTLIAVIRPAASASEVTTVYGAIEIRLLFFYAQGISDTEGEEKIG